ncbi:putative membrane transport protein [Xylanimonas cellulosilytica DSM 15894]|uniref:Membrane transport protein n=1 Tax=Xylanimonas cellulosilytica (strain DSM 15894 / JCM 12276 / CECT 5975 / KCTC 9989 / LMG 20990 / NBRC 107835 / XIL07) TaxID=446471 RepID=D1BY56_XYLCX|nr:MFS transporter [Xylanimonas cellulosilytica]ACZ29899.1 putative membrane transport protein [Xylanimonas cellulosilytica DSM 15894]
MSGPPLGPLAAGVLLTFTEPAAALLVDAGSFLVSAALMVGVRSRSAAAPRTTAASTGASWSGVVDNWLHDLRDGFREVVRRRWLAWGLGHASLFVVLVPGAVTVLGPLTVATSDGGGESWALLLTITSVGHLIGGLLALRWRPANLLSATYLVLLGAVPALLGLALELPLVVTAGLLFAYGLTLSLSNTLWGTALQQAVPLDRLGRIMSFDGAISYGLRPVGFALLGWAGAEFGVRGVLLVTAVLGAGVTVVTGFAAPVRRFAAPCVDVTAGPMDTGEPGDRPATSRDDTGEPIHEGRVGHSSGSPDVVRRAQVATKEERT